MRRLNSFSKLHRKVGWQLRIILANFPILRGWQLVDDLHSFLDYSQLYIERERWNPSRFTLFRVDLPITRAEGSKGKKHYASRRICDACMLPAWCKLPVGLWKLKLYKGKEMRETCAWNAAPQLISSVTSVRLTNLLTFSSGK